MVTSADGILDEFVVMAGDIIAKRHFFLNVSF